MSEAQPQRRRSPSAPARAPALRVVSGQPSWRVASSTVEAFVTRTGGQLGPVTFARRGRRPVRPLSVAPWATEPHAPGLPPMLAALRGDFFCMPFGGNDRAYRGARHPPHGETANADWSFRSLTSGGGRTELTLTLRTRVRPATVTKLVRLVDGHDAVYTRHAIAGASGPMNLGHHAMLRFPPGDRSGIVSTSAFVHGQVFPAPLERPAQGGYQSLRPGATFTSLSEVPALDGSTADLSRYPARRGFEDLATVVHDDAAPFAWTAVTFPSERYVWLTLKDPRVLRQTIFWVSNGGRHYAPWSGRHVDVMGIEDVASYFHEGLAASAAPNPFTRAGWPTTVRLSAKRPTTVNSVMAVVPVPRGCDPVTAVEPDGDGFVVLRAGRATLARAPIDHAFLREATGDAPPAAPPRR